MPHIPVASLPFLILKVRHPAVTGGYCIARDSRSGCSNETNAHEYTDIHVSILYKQDQHGEETTQSVYIPHSAVYRDIWILKVISHC